MTSGFLAYGVTRLIAANPVTVSLHWKTRTPNPGTGGATVVQGTDGPYRVRFVTGQEAADLLMAMGIDVTRTSDWVMLAPSGVLLRVGERSDQWLDHPTLGRFRLTRSIPLEMNNRICGWLVLTNREERGS